MKVGNIFQKQKLKMALHGVGYMEHGLKDGELHRKVES